MSKRLAERVLNRFMDAATEKSAPAKVEPYFKKVKEQNPDYSDAKAWATAWSIYCKYKKPEDSSCHQDHYFPGHEKSASPVYDKRRMSVLFVSAKALPTAMAKEIAREYVTIQNLEPYEELDIPLRVLGTKKLGASDLTQVQVDVEYPVGTGDSSADMAGLVRQVLSSVGQKYGARVEPCGSRCYPGARGTR